MDFDALRAHQEGVFSVWQLRDAGWSRGKVRHAVRGLREIHHGVRVTGDAPLTERQRCWAAVLTEPGTWLSHTSLARLAGFDDWRTEVATVTRSGTGSIQRHPGLVVHRSRHLPPGVVGAFDGIPCLSPARTVLDLVPMRSDRNARRLVRNALRVEAVTAEDLHVVLALHAGRAGIARLRQYTRDYAHLPIHRTKSDAEALGLAILDGAGVPCLASMRRSRARRRTTPGPMRAGSSSSTGPSGTTRSTTRASRRCGKRRAGRSCACRPVPSTTPRTVS